MPGETISSHFRHPSGRVLEDLEAFHYVPNCGHASDQSRPAFVVGCGSGYDDPWGMVCPLEAVHGHHIEEALDHHVVDYVVGSLEIPGALDLVRESHGVVYRMEVALVEKDHCLCHVDYEDQSLGQDQVREAEVVHQSHSEAGFGHVDYAGRNHDVALVHENMAVDQSHHVGDYDLFRVVGSHEEEVTRCDH